ncbi:MAG TPA: glycosyltransferase family A protein [Cyclobacteriaceae bacterium]|nr:glycosyltransferase family A protein [Cyclobacteriaceae bacterium]
MTISLLHPSRGRPEKSFNNSREWIEKAGCDVELILSLDKSDNTIDQYAKLYNGQINKFLVEDNNSVVEATNKAASVSYGDILLYLSDDFKCFDNWGLAVLKEFEKESRPLLLKVDDCLQNFHVPVLTIPIMNRSLYERLGYFWHPEYKSMFVDEDLYWTAHKLGAMKNAPHLKFEHAHVCVGKAPDDETYRRSSANWEHGKAVYAKRKSLGFPL